MVQSSIILFTMISKFFFISILSSLIFTTYSYNSHLLCLDHQKSLLLQLKNELIFNSSYSTKLVQWNQTDECCEWYGVECDVAGNVVSLQLDREYISGGIGDSLSLFRLKYLKKLNLAYNYNGLDHTHIPKGIHNLNCLTHLNLSNGGFGGQVPSEISSLRRLVSLDISENSVTLDYPNLEMLVQNLTGLRELYLDRVNITSSYERRKWSHIISSYLPDLTTLSLRHCSLSGPFARSFSQLHSLSILRLDGNNLSTPVPHSFANFSSLTTLTLAYCDLKGFFPNMIFQIPTLQHLDLSENELLSGSIPPLPLNGSLESIKLRRTNFSGSIPSSIGNLKALSEIDLSFCKFTGSIPSTFANLTKLTHVDFTSNFLTGSLSSVLFEGLSSLVYLILVYNSFSGKIPHSLFALPSLRMLYLNNNQFTGLIEEFSIVNVSNIAILDLSSNQLEGPIHDSLFQLYSLESLLLSENLFNGTFQLLKIQGLANLTRLDLSGNNLRVGVSKDNSTSYGFPQLNWLCLASCNMYDFPDFIKYSDMRILDLSNNWISGEIPSWIWGTQLVVLILSHNLLTDVQKPYYIPASLQILDLHSNQFRGELHLITANITYNLRYLMLSNNSLSGSIPTSLCDAKQLFVVDLSTNKFSDTIPSCLIAMSLGAMNLGGNNITGYIPDKFPLLCRLDYLDLSNNTLEGKIPKSLQHCKSLKMMNVGNNIINDTFPCMLPSSLRVLDLHSNSFHGEVTCHTRWQDLQILDISSNHFGGSLESINFSSWRPMVVQNDTQLRSNLLELYGYYSVDVFRFTMKGIEVNLVKIFEDFTAIDFSCNNFRGKIPNAIGDLSSLRLLNLSHNTLNGSIPKSFGKLGDLESLDLSRNQLTGAIPMELGGLTFFSVLNLSYNKLVGEIPNGRQLQTFSADSFKGNPELCGFNLNISCRSHTDVKEHGNDEEKKKKKREIEWEYVFAAVGYVVGLGSIVWLLLFCRRFREKYFDKIDEVVQQIFNARDMRKRRLASA